jgi:phosphatidylserine/phosphatidylglycerophosphate/cardiolipin synthase-like enzyme
MLAFVGRAIDASYGLYGAVYEFQWGAALQAIAAAARRGATVKIVYDAIQGGNGPVVNNAAAIAAAGIGPLCKPRTSGKLMHNKFFVLTRDEQPVAVWTGSTNLTENGIFGHSNLGHVIEDGSVAHSYLGYWKELEKDSTTASLKQWTGVSNIAPPNPWDRNTTVVFSPRSRLTVLDWYAKISATAKKPLFMTFAFGVNKRFQRVYEQNDGVLRIALMEKEGNGAGLPQGRIDIARIRRLPNVVVAVGNSIVLNSFDRWLKERSKLSKEVNVRYVHTKYMLVDPLGDQPVVITGSANFSEASTNTNDENMVVIQNNARVADIYVGEFMRLYSHYAFREAVMRALDNGEDPENWRPSDLVANDTWQRDYFTPGHSRYVRRKYFSGA